MTIDTELGPQAIRTSSHTLLLLIGSLWKPLFWGIPMALLLLLIFIAFGGGPVAIFPAILLGFATAGYLCYRKVPANHNAVVSRFGARIPRLLPSGISFDHPWPLYSAPKGDFVNLEPVDFLITPENVDTFEGPGVEGGQTTVILAGSAEVDYPYAHLNNGGWAKTLPKIVDGMDALVRQYCAMRTFDELRHEKGTGAAATVFRGDVLNFYGLLYDEHEEVWFWQEFLVSVSGMPLAEYVRSWGERIRTLEVKDFTPTSENLKRALDIPAEERKKAEGAQIVGRTLNALADTIYQENPGITRARALDMAGATLGLVKVQTVNTSDGGNQPRLLIQPGT